MDPSITFCYWLWEGADDYDNYWCLISRDILDSWCKTVAEVLAGRLVVGGVKIWASYFMNSRISLWLEYFVLSGDYCNAFRWEKPYYVSVSGVTSLNLTPQSTFCPWLQSCIDSKLTKLNGKALGFPCCHHIQCFVTSWQADIYQEILYSFHTSYSPKEKGHSKVSFSFFFF